MERTVLLKALGHVHRIVERRNTIPILANVLIEARGRPADPEKHRSRPRGDRIGAGRRRPERRDHRAGACHLRHRAQTAGGRAGEPRNVAATSASLLLRSGRSRFDLQACRLPTFPISPPANSRIASRLSAVDLKKLIDNTQFAISTEETRYYLNGIFLHTVDVDGKADAARGRDRRPSAGAGRDCRRRRGRSACPASSCRARR